MNAANNNATLEAVRQAVIDSLTRSDRKIESGPEAKELVETSTRRPMFRCVRLMFYI